MSNTTVDLERAWLLNQLGITYSTQATDDLWYTFLNNNAPAGSPLSSPAFPTQYAQLRTPATMVSWTTDTVVYTAPIIPASAIDPTKSIYVAYADGTCDQPNSGGAVNFRFRLNNTIVLTFGVCVGQTVGGTNFPYHCEGYFYPVSLTTMDIFGSATVVGGANGTISPRSNQVVGQSIDMTNGLTISCSVSSALNDPAQIFRLQSLQIVRMA